MIFFKNPIAAQSMFTVAVSLVGASSRGSFRDGSLDIRYSLCQCAGALSSNLRVGGTLAMPYKYLASQFDLVGTFLPAQNCHEGLQFLSGIAISLRKMLAQPAVRQHWLTLEPPSIFDMELLPRLIFELVPKSEPNRSSGYSRLRSWLERYSQEMATAEYITTHKWCGYYARVHTEFNGDQNYRFDSPMLDIQFTFQPSISPEIRADGDYYTFQGRGEDSVGSFNLTCWIEKNGFGGGTKAYEGIQLSWSWSFAMTPFGLIGRWTPPGLNPFRDGGPLWLWPKSWSRTCLTTAQ